MYLRMIGKLNCWGETINRENAFLSGDRLADLKTQHNTLSVWSYSTEEEKRDALVALAANRNNIQKMIYLDFGEGELEQLGLQLRQEMGDCKCMAEKSPEVLNRHYNIVDLDYWQLGFLSEHITKRIEEIDKNQQLAEHQLTSKEVKELIMNYVNDDKIDVEELKPGIKEGLEKEAK